jgi:hypothetical protein
MDDLARSDYPAMLVSFSLALACPPGIRHALGIWTDSSWPLVCPFAQANLQPSQAVQALTDRVKRITKMNLEVADWLQVRFPHPLMIVVPCQI